MKFKKISVKIAATVLSMITIITSMTLSAFAVEQNYGEEGEVIAVLIPQENGPDIYAEGKEAQFLYNKHMQNTPGDEIKCNNYEVNQNNDIDDLPLTRGAFHYKYRYIEKTRNNNYKLTSETKRVTNYMENATDTMQNASFSYNVSKGWTISAGVTGKFKQAVTAELGGTWTSSYSANTTFNLNIPAKTKMWIEYTPIVKRSTGVCEKYFKPRGPLNQPEYVEERINVVTTSPKKLNVTLGNKTIESPDGIYTWKSSKVR